VQFPEDFGSVAVQNVLTATDARDDPEAWAFSGVQRRPTHGLPHRDRQGAEAQDEQPLEVLSLRSLTVAVRDFGVAPVQRGQLDWTRVAGCQSLALAARSPGRFPADRRRPAGKRAGDPAASKFLARKAGGTPAVRCQFEHHEAARTSGERH